MAVTSKDIQICSNALLLIGADGINSWDDDSREAKVCQALYELSVRTLLMEHVWKFATVAVQLAQLVEVPLFDFSYQYQLPTDCVRFLGLNEKCSYRIFGAMVQTNLSPAYGIYVARVNETLFPAYFETVLVYYLAQQLAVSLAEDESKAKLMSSLYEARMKRARTIDAQQVPPAVIGDMSQIETYTVRLGG